MYNVVRGTTPQVDQVPVINGQVLFDTDKKSIFMDDNGVRGEYSSAVIADATINTTSTNAIQNQAVGNAIIDDLNTIKNVTEPLKIAGALAVKEIGQCTLLSEQFTNGNVTIPDLSQFRFIYVELGYSLNNNTYGQSTIPIEVFKNGKSNIIGYVYVSSIFNMLNVFTITYVNDTTITINIGAITNIRPKIYGVK